MDQQCEYCALGGYGELLLETRHWLIYLAPSQRYLGTCVVALKRSKTDLNQLKKEEWIEFGDIVHVMELALSELLKPTLFNWSCFKNSAFRNENPQPEIHWHFIPRYKKPVNFAGISFIDPDFGYIPQPIERKIPDEVSYRLKKMIQEKLLYLFDGE